MLALLAPVRQRFRQRLPEEIAALNGEWQTGDKSALQARLHRLKGSGGTLGFPQISQLAAAAEAALLGDDQLGLESGLDRLIAELRQTTGA